MKKLLFMVILFITTVTIFAQSRLGYTKNEIRAEYGKKIVFDNYVDEYQAHVMKVFLEDSEVWYTFDSYGVCVNVLVIPLNPKLLNFLRSKYNDMYELIGVDTWLNHISGGQSVRISIEYWGSKIGTVVYFRYD